MHQSILVCFECICLLEQHSTNNCSLVVEGCCSVVFASTFSDLSLVDFYFDIYFCIFDNGDIFFRPIQSILILDILYDFNATDLELTYSVFVSSQSYHSF